MPWLSFLVFLAGEPWQAPSVSSMVKYSKKYHAHDEKNEAKIGDTVKIIQTRPLAKTVDYELAEIIEKAVIL